MPAGLFDTAGQEPLDHADGLDAEGRYRAVAGTAIAAAVAAALSPLAFLDWSLVVVPILGVVLGTLAYRTITQRPDEFTGRPLAVGAIVVSAVSLIAGLVTLSQAYAAEPSDGIEEVIVTARQRAESIKDVPASVQAFTAADIASAGIERPQDFIALTPGVSAVQTAEVGDGSGAALQNKDKSEARRGRIFKTNEDRWKAALEAAQAAAAAGSTAALPLVAAAQVASGSGEAAIATYQAAMAKAPAGDDVAFALSLASAQASAKKFPDAIATLDNRCEYLRNHVTSLANNYGVANQNSFANYLLSIV
jgi:hypothetical protein